MAEEQKTPEVDIDTDGVNEQTIELDQKPKDPDPAFEKKEDVDLGYTDVSSDSVTGAKTAKELLQETKETEEDKSFENEAKIEQKPTEEEDGLKDYSDKVQKRIKKLTFQVREAERREKAAV